MKVRVLRAALLILSTSFLNGCISLLPENGPAPAQISLEPVVEKTQLASQKTLKVVDPNTPLNLSGSKIVVKKVNDAGLTVYTIAQGQEWTQPLPKLLQRMVVDHFRSSSWPGIVGANKTLPVDYQLELDVRKFNIILNHGVEVEINAALFNTSTNKIEASQTFSYMETSSPNVRGYIDAFNKASGRFLTDMSHYFERHIKN